jgi:NAD-dependent SIR2 family protein deacetylase
MMDKSEIFKKIQKYTEDNPLFFIGSGASAAYGLPGMGTLGDHLLSSLSSKYKTNDDWQRFEDNLKSGKDLETAMTDIVFKEEIIDDIRKETWKLISEKDLAVFSDVVFNNKEIALSKLIKLYCQSHPQKVDIITTNYDRLIEYACDKARLTLNDGFSGHYTKHYSDSFAKKNAVNLVKVHGSLDWFKDGKGLITTLPLQKEIPLDLVPEIITPGVSKYQAVLTGIERSLLSRCDAMIKNAVSYLCIGYGFNDAQIQALMIQEIQSGKPLVLVTMEVKDDTARLLENNAMNYAYICKGDKEDTTKICINNEIYIVDGTYWTIDGFINIIN